VDEIVGEQNEQLDAQQLTPPVVWSPAEMFGEVHGRTKMHFGSRRTWLAMNKRFPGHKLPYAWIAEQVSACPTCQKDRLLMSDYIEPVVRHLKPKHRRQRVGVDNLTVTPKDAAGNGHLIVIVDHFTKYVWVQVAKEYTATTVATALFVYLCTFGMFDELWSDPGSDLMSEVVAKLTKWLGIRHVISLVDRHESNGVEGTNKQILRHLTTLTHEYRATKRWSEPIFISLVIFVINDSINSETGLRPLDTKFGSDDGPYYQLPKDLPPDQLGHAWLRALNEDLRNLREASMRHQQQIAAERTSVTPEEEQNRYQRDDLVLFQLDPNAPKPTKLSSGYLGPYKVVQQVKNDVECQHMCSGHIRHLHVTRLKLFNGTATAAYEQALIDADQHVIEAIVYFRGDPMRRSEMFFMVRFADGEEVLLPYSQDLAGAQQFGEYIFSDPQLFPLRFNASGVSQQLTILKRQPIVGIELGEEFYIDLRFWGYDFYDSLDLPNMYVTRHVVLGKYYKWRKGPGSHVQVYVPVFLEYLRDWDYYDVSRYGRLVRLTAEMTLVTSDMCAEFPMLNPDPPKPKKRTGSHRV
jgi:hypothetical protein